MTLRTTSKAALLAAGLLLGFSPVTGLNLGGWSPGETTGTYGTAPAGRSGTRARETGHRLSLLPPG
jgi:hypothetical protein